MKQIGGSQFTYLFGLVSIMHLILLLTVSVKGAIRLGDQCTTRFGYGCVNCNYSMCTQCLPNFTLTVLSNSTYGQWCVCEWPYLLNLTQINSTYLNQPGLINQDYPNQICILCTDKFSISTCIPTAFNPQLQLFTTRVSTNTTNITNAPDYSMIISFSPSMSTILKSTSWVNLTKWFSVHWGVDGQLIPSSYITFRNFSDTNSLQLDIPELNTLVCSHYRSKNYRIPTKFTIQLRRRNISMQIFVNGSGNPLPQSYRPPLRFKSLANGFNVDSSYVRFYNGNQAIVYQFNWSNMCANTQNSTTNQTPNINNTNNTNNIDNDNNNNINTNDTDINDSNEHSSQIITKVNNNFGISHTFQQVQIKIKQAIQIAFTVLASLGLLSTSAVHWLTFTLAMTYSFNQTDMYSQFVNNQTFVQNSSRLLFTHHNYSNNRVLQSNDNMTIQIANLDSLHMLLMVSNLTLVYNPLILSEPTEHILTTNSFSNYSRSLAYTYLLIFACALGLTLFLVYINEYIKGKTHYDHSHIFKTLSERNMVKRVVFLVLKGIYPIMAYSTVIFVTDIVDIIQKKKVLRFDLNNWHELWNLIYGIQCCIFAVAVVALPTVGLLVFDRYDKHNIYIYSRMYAEEQPTLKNEANSQQSQQSQSNQSQPSSTNHNNDNNNNNNNDNNNKQTHLPQALQQSENSCVSMNNTTTKFLTSSSVKKYNGSIKPLLYFLFEFAYIDLFIVCIVFINGNLQNYIAIGLTSFYFVFTLYCAITVCVSKTYVVIKIVEIVLIDGFLVCRFLWYTHAFAAAIAFYLMYLIGAVTVISILFNAISIIYWEKKGLGVYAFFINKVAPTSQNFGKQEIQEAKQIQKFNQILQNANNTQLDSNIQISIINNNQNQKDKRKPSLKKFFKQANAQKNKKMK